MTTEKRIVNFTDEKIKDLDGIIDICLRADFQKLDEDILTNSPFSISVSRSKHYLSLLAGQGLIIRSNLAQGTYLIDRELMTDFQSGGGFKVLIDKLEREQKAEKDDIAEERKLRGLRISTQKRSRWAFWITIVSALMALLWNWEKILKLIHLIRS